MRKLIVLVLFSAWLSCAGPLRAQQGCAVEVDTPEDELMLAVNGADNPQEQVAALDKYAQAHSDSKFMPCVNESYTNAYLKLNNFDKAIEYGEKDIAANFLDLNLLLNLMKAYVGSGKVNDAAFDVLAKAPDAIKSETNPSRPSKATDEEWQKTQQDLAQQAKDDFSYMEYAFFQLLPRVPDGAKRIQYLDGFSKAYPDTPNGGQLNFQYFIAYTMANNSEKADEYCEKALAVDPNNVEYLNAVSNDYATRQVNLDKSDAYAKKVLELAPGLKKPEGISDSQFKTVQDNQMGLAHATMGYVAFLKGSKTHRVAPAIQEFKTAVDLLNGNTTLQARTLYYLGYAYEVNSPPNHKLAADALARAAGISSPWQALAQDLLGKVRKAPGQ